MLKTHARRSLVTVAILVSLMLMVTASGFAAPELILLHTNDVHGRLESHGDNDQGGLVRVAYLVEQIRAEHGDNVILLDGGDNIHGTNIVNLFDGKSAIEVLNAMEYDAMVLGNHEFNYGQEVLKARMDDANFPVLAGNVFHEDGSVFGYSAYVFERAGYNIGVIGLVAQDTPVVTHPNNVQGLQFKDPIEVGKQLATSVRPDVDLLIALTHIGYELDRKLAEAAPEIDVIVGGHSHTTIESETEVNGVIIAQSHEYGNYVGQLRLLMDQHGDLGVLAYEQDLLPVTGETPKHPEIDRIVAHWNELLQAELSEVVGSTRAFLDGERASVRRFETNLGNLVADVMRESVDADMAFANGGGIRASISSGEVTVGDVYTVLPFDNTLVKLELTGEQVLEALEHGVRNWPSENGGFLQVSGLSFYINSDAEPGSRVEDVIVNGQPLDPNGRYTVATNDFMAAGGDGYAVLAEAELLADTGIMLRDVLVEHFRAQGSIEVPVLDRIFAR